MRTYTNLFTAIAILAVDFTIFPRRFAKTETYGTGLMDIGVGLFVVAHGLTAPEARGLSNTRGYVWRVLGTARRVLPLMVLGCVRLASVKLTGYQEHVAEYGVHWNFFFTIAFIRVLCTAILPLLSFLPPLFPYATSSLLLAFLHQLFLSLAGGTEYVLLGPSRDGSRTGLLSANREGVVSSVGYLAVYMAGIQLGQWIFKKRKSVSEFYHIALFLGVGVVLLWTLTSVCEVYVQPVSRRMANLPFILWLFSQVFLFLLLFLFTDLLLLKLWHTIPSSPLPSPLYTTASNKHTTSPLCVVSAIDYNQLSFFLLANLLTGLVNFSLDTLHTSRPLALAVLVGYMCVLVSISIALHRHSVKIKL
jgi:phosphatidylinositol glycan class W